MKANRRALGIALLAVEALLAAARANEVPRRYPELDLRNAATSIVVAKVSGIANLPETPECARPDAMCMVFPFWYHADIRETLLGAPLEPDTNVTSINHFAGYAFANGPPWRLLVLQSVGNRVQMTGSPWRPLVERSDGELFMIDDGMRWPGWLPCAVTDLREPLGDAKFEPDPAARRDEETGEFGRDVTDHPEKWRIDGDRALPRAGVRVTRLRTLLRQLAEHHQPTDCRRPD